MADSLRALVAEELAISVDPRVRALAQAIADQHRQAARAILFYGSCLRDDELDGRMLDFYLIVSSYGEAYDKHWLASANRLIPPNVFYFERDGLAAKYAVLSEADFARECGPKATSTSVLARFAQPLRLVFTADSAATAGIIDSISDCAPTLLRWTVALAPEKPLLDIWKLAFRQTFSTELRAERSDRSAEIVDADRDRYTKFAEAAAHCLHSIPDRPSASRWWRRMKLRGKFLSVLRLVKASFTFAGGADYIAWKINRHAGTRIELSPWQRRHPLLTGLTLLPRLLRSGAIR